MTTQQDTSLVRPFRAHVPQEDVDDLRERLARTRLPGDLPGEGWSRGVPPDVVRDLVAHWLHRFDWRRAEAALNEVPQVVTTVVGQTLHALHVRSPEPGALPLVLTHG